MIEECKTECASFFFCAHFQPIEVCERNVLSGLRAHSNIPIQKCQFCLILRQVRQEFDRLERDHSRERFMSSILTTHGFHKPPFQRFHERQGSSLRCSLNEAESSVVAPFPSFVICIFMSHYTLHFTCSVVSHQKKTKEDSGRNTEKLDGKVMVRYDDEPKEKHVMAMLEIKSDQWRRRTIGHNSGSLTTADDGKRRQWCERSRP